jgi:NAD(P)-dependent dehydrogenase (short-subunit alcohol dehydrogenase family)
MGTLDGQVVVITGAGKGIGRSLALRLAAEGASVGLMARTAADVESVTAEVAATGAGVVGEAFDVADLQAVTAFVGRVEEQLGPITLLVNNAGRTGEWDGTPMWNADLDDWWGRVETNLRGPVNFVRAVLPGMVERHAGRVVNVNSGAGAAGAPWTDGAYPVSKAGLFRLTDHLATTLAQADAGVVVLDVSPGLVRTREGNTGIPDSAYTPVERVCDLVVAVAQGRLDGWNGRYVHATDDIDHLVASTGSVAEAGGRVLRMRAGWDGDPQA